MIESIWNVAECIFAILYDSFWPFILWLSPLLLLLSLTECLVLSDIGRNPLQRPIPPWQWEQSCGLALPLDPPWKSPRIRKRKQSHFSFVRREQSRFGSVRHWFRHVQEEALEKLPWEDSISIEPVLHKMVEFDPVEADVVLTRLDPLEYHRRFLTLSSNSFLSTGKEESFQKRALWQQLTLEQCSGLRKQSTRHPWRAVPMF